VLYCVGVAYGGQSAEVQERARSLAGKIVRFREAQNVFAKPELAAIIAQLEDFAALDPGEGPLLQRMVRKCLTLRSTCFGGTSVGMLEADHGATKTIDFAYDRERGGKVYWHEH
jgi:hypothetical protein